MGRRLRGASLAVATVFFSCSHSGGSQSGRIAEKDWTEISATVSTPANEVQVEGTLLLPRDNSPVRGVIAGGSDATAGVKDSEELWKSGRSSGAPWTFAVEPGATHGSRAALKKSNPFVMSWIAAVFRQRVVEDRAGLCAVKDDSAWLGDIRTGEIAPHSSFSGPAREATWLPDEASARAWQVATGKSK